MFETPFPALAGAVDCTVPRQLKNVFCVPREVDLSAEIAVVHKYLLRAFTTSSRTEVVRAFRQCLICNYTAARGILLRTSPQKSERGLSIEPVRAWPEGGGLSFNLSCKLASCFTLESQFPQRRSSIRCHPFSGHGLTRSSRSSGLAGGVRPRWPSGKVSALGPGSKPESTEDPPCMGPVER
ncbi:hypothetical protein AVEN_260526-1 [Araneus ventricosus]|uniref:Uncharacterized protein n=1 Tax=Araneus ventricosus TaxID=182803 RepID=A0A4Y2MW82_ARAVE|nr:hypothetical protein AVEN_260526-1 [Araneus ventricosus]